MLVGEIQNPEKSSRGGARRKKKDMCQWLAERVDHTRIFARPLLLQHASLFIAAMLWYGTRKKIVIDRKIIIQ
jgi:hypothetical protein